MAVLVLALCWLGLLLTPGAKAAEDEHMPHDNNQTTDGVQSLCQALDPSPQVQPFVEELTQPPVIDISTGQQLTLGVYKIKQKFHPDLPETTLYAYGTSQETASTPGPTLLATRGIESYVRWENHLNDSEHFLTVDHSIHWANPKSGGVPIVTHLHGGEVLSESDGYPDAWYTSAGELGPAFTTQNYTTEGAVVRSMTLSEYDDGNDNPTGSLLNGLRWRDPLTETPELNATEVWEIINLTEDAHPIHLHLVSFRVKSQQAFDAVRQANYNCSFFVPFPDPKSCFTEAPQKPELHHRGWKDTATVYPGKVTVFVVRWATQSGEQFSFDATSGPGYVWHCHILDHEDNDMMRPLKMMAANSSQLP
ncbi:hypothetical protein AXG93_2506s1060 [Marchantia polymorpha subsp. ruderalis]|uniref:Plastocyanin-like domain-containing protein n=1 Tax=Marchantia polymorpha subsp. ruderalis TaxID=1480154 RepID=A0A176W0C0_MARPO|nr:hypothetical protein AXG93_2506s1060 [Marchantia polymorpha subsp. ruderalis]